MGSNKLLPDRTARQGSNSQRSYWTVSEVKLLKYIFDGKLYAVSSTATQKAVSSRSLTIGTFLAQPRGDMIPNVVSIVISQITRARVLNKCVSVSRASRCRSRQSA